MGRAGSKLVGDEKAWYSAVSALLGMGMVLAACSSGGAINQGTSPATSTATNTSVTKNDAGIVVVRQDAAAKTDATNSSAAPAPQKRTEIFMGFWVRAG